MNRLLLSILSILLLVLISGVQARAQEDLIPCEEETTEEVTEEVTEPMSDAGFVEIPGPIEDMVPGWTVNKGLFKYYTEAETRKNLIELRPDQLDHEILLSVTLSKGTGDDMFAAPMLWNNSLVRFHRDGQTVELVTPNTQVSTVAGEPMAMAVENGVSDRIFGRVPIEAENEDGRIVFDLTLFLGSFLDLEMMGSFYGYMFIIDYEGSYITQIKGFPLNDEIDSRVILQGAGDIQGWPQMDGQELGFHFSLSEPPPPGYVSRLSDDRVGFFEDVSMLYSVGTDKTETRYLRYINRWRLEKKDPTAAMSEPVQPIVFWIENTTPYEYRDAIRAGIEFWDTAFEKAGFINAIQAKQMPDDADWDPADIRYNAIRWFVDPMSVYAIGPCRTDPRTGEIYDADIGMNADMLTGPYLNYEMSVDPLNAALELMMPPGWPNLNGMQVPWNDETLKILDERNERYLDGDALFSLKAFEAARASEIMRVRSDLDLESPEVEKFVYNYVLSLVAHEVGHTLGLRHNFAGSAGTSYWKMQQPYWTQRHGLSESIMDYTTVNISAPGAVQGEYFQTVPGDYDNWAIEFGYTPVNMSTSQDETPALNEIAMRAPDYRYATDEDYSGWTRNMDPDTWLWDLGDDPIRYSNDRIASSKEIIDRILDYYSVPGTRPARIRLSFVYAFWEYIQAASSVPRLIGGVRMYRDHVGDIDSHYANEPVSAEDQRRALEFLRDKLWASDNYQYDPELLVMLGKDRSSTLNWGDLMQGTLDFDLQTYVLIAQQEPFYWLYDPLVLTRVINNERRMLDGEEPFTIVELFDTVRGSIWSELQTGSPIDSFRRNLQRAHLQMITGIVLSPANGTPEDAIALARRDLNILKQSIENNLSSDSAFGMDTMTKAHLEECLSIIDQTLTAPANSGGSITLMF